MRCRLALPGRCTARRSRPRTGCSLNTRERPFDDIGVRRAVNFAIDRAKVVELSGGPELGELTCQVVPANFHGNAPYCPHTAPTKRRQGLDRSRHRAGTPARRSLRSCGRARHRPGAGLPGSGRTTSRAGAERARLPDDGAGAVLQRRHDRPRAQLGFTGWLADYLAASTFIEPAFTCAERGGYNLSRICDPKLDRLIDRARADAACGRRRRLGGRRPPPHLPGRCGAADPPSLRGARLRSSRQRQDARAAIHVAGPDVGEVTIGSNGPARRRGPVMTHCVPERAHGADRGPGRHLSSAGVQPATSTTVPSPATTHNPAREGTSARG